MIDLGKVLDGKDLSENEMMEIMQKIMSGDVSDIQIASFLTALKIKGESINEIVGGAKVLREKAIKADLSDYYTVDTCGTGGDKLGTYNISTAVAFVCAASGVKVVKHGNRSVSSKCGSADVLEELGVKIDLDVKQVEVCVKEVGIGFFFAQKFHSAMRHVANTRKTLGFRTIFNILGPLSNPASADAQVLGVFDENLTFPLCNVLKNLGLERALVVHGKDGLDEFSISGDTTVCELKDGKISSYIVNPKDFGLGVYDVSDIKGGDKAQNAQIIRDLLNGKQGAMRDILLLNAGAAIYVGKKAESLAQGVEIAKEMIDSKKALAKLDSFIAKTNSF